MRFIGGINHAELVPESQRGQYCIEVLYGERIVRYIRHLEHYVIFGMTPTNAAELINQLEPLL